MKKFVFRFSALVIVPLVLFVLCGCAGGGSEGIRFFEGSWQDAVNKAKAQQKPIFLDIYATWCGPCKMLRSKTFTDKDVAKYFNANYVCISLDGEKGDGADLAAKYHIPGYPTLMLFDKNGNPVTTETGYLEPTDLLDFAKQGAGK